VEGRGKPFWQGRKAAPVGRIGTAQVRNRLPARIFTVDIPPRGSTIRAIRFPQPSLASFNAVELGTKETCEETL
jgi:hypothetical protein